jgi:hypothetical protein
MKDLFWMIVYTTKEGDKRWMYVKTEPEVTIEDVPNVLPGSWVDNNVNEFVKIEQCDFQDDIDWDLTGYFDFE